MKYLMIAAWMITLTKVNAQQSTNGTISGNVYWKYNDYVGNKADAGSEVQLTSLTNPSTTFKSTCDLQGNYKIEGIQPGRYFLIIKSKNTKQDPVWYSRIFGIYKLQLDTVLSTNVSSFRPDLQAEIDTLYNKQMALVKDYAQNINKWKPSKYIKENEKLKTALHDKIKEWFSVMPSDLKMKLDTYYYIHESFYYQIVEITTNKSETIVTDFGITYL